MKLTDEVTKVFRTNPKQQKALKRLGIETIRDLLFFFPSRYSDISVIRPIRDVRHGDTVTIYGTIRNPRTKKSFRTKIPMATAELVDMNGDTLGLSWFNQAYIAKQLTDGDTVQLTGKITERKEGGLVMNNSEFEHVPTLPIDSHDSLFGESGHEVFGFPVYRETRGITSKWLYHSIRKICASGILDTLIDPIPQYIRSTYNLPSLATALIWIHMPKRTSDGIAARKRFAFQEIFLVQIHKQRERTIFESHESFVITPPLEKMLSFTERFPFAFTSAQERVIGDILADMASGSPMSRLLEGDVGSGKTAVAATITRAVTLMQPGGKSYGHLQVAYMAPTEVLATQLFESFLEHFVGSGLQIVLLTGKTVRKFPSKVNPASWTDISKAQAKKWIANGEIPIVIGTHALIQKTTEFKNLGLVIIDEQHRFGTTQRSTLVRKDDRVPHLLSMTATPIPRTLALTIYGDLDLSVIDELPAGRKPVITSVVPEAKRDETYEALRHELEAGRQAYVICPRIDEPDEKKETALRVASVTEEAKRLHELFPDYTIGVMHGKLKKESKQRVMDKFSGGSTNILVSTSVIEVGINVPNATVILIEGAERFGLSQLHQLRGRVARSSHQARCYLFSDTKTQASIDRLRILEKTTDGFELAEHDLMNRGAGDLAGRKQWGLSDIAMEAIKNITMVEAARKEAKNLLAEDFELENFPELADYITTFTENIHME